MLIGAFVAFGHFLAFFALAAALVLELTLIAESMSLEVARRIQRADRVAGLSAVLLLLFGSLRALFYEKGADYYLDNSFFQIKIALFLLAALISAYPTIRFLRWNSELAQDIAPGLSAIEVTRLKRAIHWELMLVGGILVCASLMAKGFGS